MAFRLFPFIVAVLVSGCAAEAPVAPTSQSGTQQQGLPGSPIGAALAIDPTNPFVGQTTAFIASGSSMAAATLDFGDGSHVAFTLVTAPATTLSHAYSHAGTFVATLTATNADGQSTSVHESVAVR